jgi:hypothetical protein
MKNLAFFLAGLFFAIHASAVTGTTVLSSRITVRPNGRSTCAVTGTCALTDVRFIENKELFRFDNEPLSLASHFTTARFIYSTATPADLESFGVVQLIRGCMYHSRPGPGPDHLPVLKELSIMRDEFGTMVPFKHETWQIDNDNDDPLITAYKEHGRFALLRWNADPSSYVADGAHYYGQSKPPHSTVFMADTPGSGALMPDAAGADNTSLEFKTCLFKITDLPAHTTPDGAGVDFNRALWCANWEHKNIWNFKTAKMDHPAKIDSFCEVSGQ